MSEFKVGAVVSLKSGGPRMTVIALGKVIEGPDEAVCAWFNIKDRLRTAPFPLASLRNG